MPPMLAAPAHVPLESFRVNLGFNRRVLHLALRGDSSEGLRRLSHGVRQRLRSLRRNYRVPFRVAEAYDSPFSVTAVPVRVARLGVGIAIVLLVGCTLRRMEQTATRTVHVPAAGATVLVLNAGAGNLKVQGVSSATEVLVTGTAHAATVATLNGIRIASRRAGDTILVSAILPPSRHDPGVTASLDLTIQLPPSLALDVVDTTGESTFRNVGTMRLRHGDGGLDIDTVGGSLDITDGGGDMVVANVYGDVHIVDGGGAIYLNNIAGSVGIPQDGSGEIQLSSIGGDVTVGSKSSGEVAARGIGGNLVVRANGNGSIEYRDVKGHVTIPAARYH